MRENEAKIDMESVPAGRGPSRSGIPFAFALAGALGLALLAPSPARALSQQIFSGSSADLGYSNQRKVLYSSGTAPGYWTFFSTGSGATLSVVYSYSKTGEEGTWSTPRGVFTDSGYSYSAAHANYSGQASIWFDPTLGQVAVVAPPNAD